MSYITDLIKSTVIQGLGCIELCAEQKLNALDTEMLQSIKDSLLAWENNKQVHAVVITSASEKAFCAGGDVKKLSLDIQSFGMSAANSFFSTEYSTDYLIHTYKKPIVVFASGITMGGGIGIMNGASHRIVTEKTTMAMPEVSIGLFPDVGASYFLNRLKNNSGLILGLTAYRWTGHEAVALGMADYWVNSDRKEQLLSLLKELSWSEDITENHKKITHVLSDFSEKKSQGIFEDNEFLNLANDHKTIEELFSKIGEFTPRSDRAIQAHTAFQEGSRLSKSLIWEQFRRGKNLNLKDCFAMEWQLALNCCEYGDFIEGVTAKLIKKTKNPNWLGIDEQKLNIEDYFYRSEENNFLKSSVVKRFC